VGDGPDDDIPPLHLLLPPVDGARDQMGDNPSKDVGEDDVPDVFIQTSLSSSFTALHDILQEYRVWFDDHLPRHGRLSGHTLDPRFLTWILTVVPLVLELHLGLAVQEEQYVRDTADLLQAVRIPHVNMREDTERWHSGWTSWIPIIPFGGVPSAALFIWPLSLDTSLTRSFFAE
jgi:hypothetical protein